MVYVMVNSVKGKIIKQISNAYSVLGKDKIYICTPRGRFRKMKMTPLIGDECLIDEKNNYILEIEPRKNELKRPSVANVDVGLIVVSMVKPDFDSLLLDKEITSIILANVTPMICFTKLDLLNKISKNKKLL